MPSSSLAWRSFGLPSTTALDIGACLAASESLLNARRLPCFECKEASSSQATEMAEGRKAVDSRVSQGRGLGSSSAFERAHGSMDPATDPMGEGCLWRHSVGWRILVLVSEACWLSLDSLRLPSVDLGGFAGLHRDRLAQDQHVDPEGVKAPRGVSKRSGLGYHRLWRPPCDPVSSCSWYWVLLSSLCAKGTQGGSGSCP